MNLSQIKNKYMTDLVKYLKFEELDEFSQKLYLITKKEVENFCNRFLFQLGYEVNAAEYKINKEGISKVSNTSFLFDFSFKNQRFLRRFEVSGIYLFGSDEDLDIPKDSFWINIMFNRTIDEFWWGGRGFSCKMVS